MGTSDLHLESPSGPPPEAQARRESLRHYGKTYAEYVVQFGIKGKDAERKLKRYVARGRLVTPVDLPPFDAPHELAAWWRRMKVAGLFKWGVPDWMTLLEQVGPVSAASSSSPPVQNGTSGTAAAPSVPSAPAAEGATLDMPPDFDLPVMDDQASSGERQLREFAEGWLAEMATAKRTQNTARFFKAWNEYKALIKELRAWQKDRQREKLQSGEVLEAVRETEALGVIFGAMNKTFTSSLMLLVERFAPDLDVTARRRAVLPFRDKIFSALKGTRFETAIPDEQLATYLAA